MGRECLLAFIGLKVGFFFFFFFFFFAVVLRGCAKALFYMHEEVARSAKLKKGKDATEPVNADQAESRPFSE